MKNNEILKPLFKYPGGKSKEYKHIKKFFPEFKKYVEPFLGGGAVYWAVDADNWVINDYSKELISIYKYTQIQNNKFIKYVEDISKVWILKNNIAIEVEEIIKNNLDGLENDVPDLGEDIYKDIWWLKDREEKLNKEIKNSIIRKTKSLKRVSKNNIIENIFANALGVVGSAVYTDFRTIYNETAYSQSPELKTALYLFLREYSYSSMFRYNSSGEFNVPFGGNTYAKKDFNIRMNQIKDSDVVEKLQGTEIMNGDFSKVLIDQEETFIFLDPPYDSEFSTYNLHVFDAKEQIRLHDELLEIKKSKWMMVIKMTPFIEKLYNEDVLYLNKFDKSYSVNFKNRNVQDVEHLVITNYRLE